MFAKVNSVRDDSVLRTDSVSTRGSSECITFPQLLVAVGKARDLHGRSPIGPQLDDLDRYIFQTSGLEVHVNVVSCRRHGATDGEDNEANNGGLLLPAWRGRSTVGCCRTAPLVHALQSHNNTTRIGNLLCVGRSRLLWPPASMARGRRTRLTAQDILRDGGIVSLIKGLTKGVSGPVQDVAEAAAAQLSSLADMNHGEHCDALIEAGIVGPLVGLLTRGTTAAVQDACRTLKQLFGRGIQVQRSLVDAGGVEPLVALVKTGSAKVQEAATSAIAGLDKDPSHQRAIIKAGAAPTLVAMLKGLHMSASGQSCAAMALANMAVLAEGQQAVSKAGAIPRLLALLA